MDWIKVTYMTANGEAGQTLLPKSALFNNFDNTERRAWLMQEWAKPYYKTLAGNAPEAIVNSEPANLELRAVDDIGLAWLISHHDLTFSFSDDSRSYRNGQASLNLIHNIVRSQPSFPLAQTLLHAWNSFHLSPTADAESRRMFGLTAERVQEILTH